MLVGKWTLVNTSTAQWKIIFNVNSNKRKNSCQNPIISLGKNERIMTPLSMIIILCAHWRVQKQRISLHVSVRVYVCVCVLNKFQNIFELWIKCEDKIMRTKTHEQWMVFAMNSLTQPHSKLGECKTRRKFLIQLKRF